MKHQVNLTRNLGRVLDQYVEARTTSVPLRGWIPSRTVDLTGTAIRHGPTEYLCNTELIERRKCRCQIAKSPPTFSSSSTCNFSAVSHICSTVIESRSARKVSPALRTAGSMTRS